MIVIGPFVLVLIVWGIFRIGNKAALPEYEKERRFETRYDVWRTGPVEQRALNRIKRIRGW